MGLGFNFGSQKSKSSSEFGINREDRDLAFDTFFPQFQQLPSFLSDIRGVATPQLNLGATGLTQSQEGLAGRLLAPALRQQTNLVSSNNALRGQVSPLNFGNVVQGASERALTKVLPQFISQVGQNELFNVTSPLQTEQTKFQAALGMFDAISKLFQGGSSKGVGNSFNFGFDSGLSAGFGGGQSVSGGGSHPSYKEDIEPIDKDYVQTINNVPLYKWKYKSEYDQDTKTRIGGLTTEMPPELVTSDGMRLDLVSYIGVLTGAIKQLHKKIEQLEGKV